jgi:hypothetical protein
MVYCKNIKLINESSWPEVRIKKIIAFLKGVLPNNVINEEKESQVSLNSIDNEKNFSFFNQAIIHDLKKPLPIYDLNHNHSYHYNTEKKMFPTKNKSAFGDSVLYDGFIIQILFQKLMKNHEEELSFSNLNILITDKLLCTFDESDWRYHARSLICGTPTLISTTGIVEGIAKPRDYYYKLYFFLENPDIVDDLKKDYNGQFINYNDHRINDIIEGLILQALFYFINSGEPFCQDRNCRLFNAHFQDDVIRLNLKERKICQKHKILLNKYIHALFIDNNCIKEAEE